MQNEVQVGRYNGILAKLLSMKERAPTPVVGAEIIAGITLEQDRPEWKFLGGESLVMAAGSAAQTAVNFAKFKLRNPASSGVIIVLEELILFNENVTGSGDAVAWELQPAGSVVGFGLALAQQRDTRKGISDNQAVSGQVYSAGSVGGILGNGYRFRTVAPTMATGPAMYRPLIVISPGFDLVGQSQNNVALTIVAQFLWRERILEPSESR